MATLHVSWTIKGEQRLLRTPCATCGQRTRQYEWFQDWYGWHTTCLSCGEQWQDGERCPRPFKPRWRAENIARAKAAWARYRREATR